MIIFIVVVSVVRLISQLEELSAFNVVANRIMMEAKVWVRKYFVVASIDRGWWVFEIIGTIDRVLISRHAHAMSQWVVVVIRMVLVMMLVGITIQDAGLISRGLWAFSGYGPDSLFS